VLLGLQLLAFWAVGRVAGWPRGFPLDDAWIHQVVARVLAQTGTLGFTEGVHGGGASSWLWAGLLAINQLLFHAGPAAYAAALNGALYLAAGQLVFGLLRHDGEDEWLALGLSVAFACAGNFVWFAWSGMEATLVAFLSVLAIHAWFASERRSSAVGAGLCVTALFFTRPETLGLVLLLCLAKRRVWRDVAALAGAALGGLLVYAGLNWLHTGALFPPTLAGRRWLWLLPFPGWSRLQLTSELLLTWADRLAEYSLGTPSPPLFFTALGFALWGLVSLVRGQRWRTLALVGWALLHLATYAVLLPSLGHGGRYQPLIPAVFCLLVCQGLFQVATDASGLLRQSRLLARSLQGALFAGLAYAMALALVAWGPAHALAVQHVDTTEVAMGLALHKLPKQARVASFDIGGIGYFADRPVIDLGGLVHPELVARLRAGTIAEYLREQRADFVILPLGYQTDFPDFANFGEILGLFRNPKLELEPAFQLVTRGRPWLEGARATMHSSPRQRLYRIHWPEQRQP
jgi:hypothetical protein